MLHEIESNVEKVISRAGFATLCAAALLSVVELEHVRAPKLAIALQPAFATTQNQFNRGEELMRREKEETFHTEASYDVTMRSHPTAGKQ